MPKKNIRLMKSRQKGATGTDRSLDLYLREIGEKPLLSREEELTVARRIREGDETAIEELVRANLRFAVDVAKNYQNQGMSLADLINEGNVGLVKAAKRFDPERGFKFISYAVWWIRQAILAALAQQSRAVRIPLNRVGVMRKITKEHASLERELGRSPDARLLADLTDTTSDEVIEALQLMERTLSLDAPIPGGKGGQTTTLGETLEDERVPDPLANMVGMSLEDAVEEALKELPLREAEVIRLLFGIGGTKPLTLEQVGTRFNLTRERIRQIKEKALRRLRHPAKKKKLKDFEP